MAQKTIQTEAQDGSTVEFVESSTPLSGAMKEVYFSPNKDYVVAFYNYRQTTEKINQLKAIVGRYRKHLFENDDSGEFWKSLFCWPEKIVEYDGKIGIVVPAYSSAFYFQKDPKRKGMEKEGKWFANAKLLRLIDESERGNFLNYLKICLKLAQAIRHLHSAGLAHSDLSYKTVLIDPSGGKACITDCDGLLVPGYSPDVLGTPDFIAPEVLSTRHLKYGRKEPSQSTDRHALAVLIYMYLLHRHPLKGGRYFGPDYDDEEAMMMGTDPLFIEHPTDHRNSNMKREYGDDYNKCLPWVDLQKLPAEKVCGPYLWELFQKAFIDGLKDPFDRPFADEWETALVKTLDCILPCSNPKCSQKYFVNDGTNHPECPFCGTRYKEFAMPTTIKCLKESILNYDLAEGIAIFLAPGTGFRVSCQSFVRSFGVRDLEPQEMVVCSVPPTRGIARHLVYVDNENKRINSIEDMRELVIATLDKFAALGAKTVAMNGIRCDDRPDPTIRPETYQKRFVEEYVASHPDAFEAICLVDLRGGFKE